MEQLELGDEAPDAADEAENRDVVAQATRMLAAQVAEWPLRRITWRSWSPSLGWWANCSWHRATGEDPARHVPLA